MTRRFLRCQWSPLRLRMDAMAPGEVMTLTRDTKARGQGNYYLALTSARRLREAYEGTREWTVRVSGKDEFTISHHTKP